MKKFSFFILILTLISCSKNNIIKIKTCDKIIFTKGNGGDANGANIIISDTKFDKKCLINLTSSGGKIEDYDLKNINNIMFLGQGIIHDLINTKDYDFSKKDISLYSHVYDTKIKSFLKVFNAKKINLYLTNSQLKILKPDQSNVVIHNNPLVLETVEKQNTKLNNNFISSDIVIWLGGSYVGSNGTQIIVSNDNIKNILQKIKKDNKIIKDISFIIAPRFIESNFSNKDIIARFNLLTNIFKNSKIKFYMSEGIYKKISPIIKDINLANYNDLINYFNQNNHKIKHYGTVDQYNLFADLHKKIIPIVYYENDIDQLEYANSIKNKINQLSLTELIKQNYAK
jgi:hypothetical protein